MAKWLQLHVYKYFLPDLSHVTTLPCENQMFWIVT